MSLADKIKELDLNNLDFKNPGAWPFPVMVMACLIVFIVIPLIGYQVYLSDMVTDLKRVQQKEVSLKREFETKAKESANLEEYKAQMQTIQQSFEVLLGQLPKDTEVPGLIEDITKAGLSSGLEFSEIKLLNEVSRQVYKELPVQISVTGNYHSFANFATKVAALPRIVTLNDFSMKPVVNGDSSKIKITVLAKTYRYQGDK